MYIDLKKSIELLKKNQVVALPTETVYGLAANAYSNEAVTHIYKYKKRPLFNPLIIHYASYDHLQKDVIINAQFKQQIQDLWHNKLSVTVVLNSKIKTQISSVARAGYSTVACRVPHHSLFQDILEHLNFPLAAPSANRSNHISPTRAEHVIRSLGENIPLLKGGKAAHGLESTILDLSGEKPIILRYGAVSLVKLQPFFKEEITFGKSSPSAGQLKHHYAPDKKIRLNVNELNEGEALLAFGHTHLPHNYNLSIKGCVNEAASNLFDMLYALEASSCTHIAVMPIPSKGLGIAINDRLSRAASNSF